MKPLGVKRLVLLSCHGLTLVIAKISSFEVSNKNCLLIQIFYVGPVKKKGEAMIHRKRFLQTDWFPKQH